VHVDLARELKAHLSARLARSGATVTASDAGGQPWARPALGLAPVAPDQAHLAIRLAAKEDADVLLSGLDDAVLDEVDIRVIGIVRALTAPTPEELQRRTRPLVPGLSVAHPMVTAGTLGGFVRVGGRRSCPTTTCWPPATPPRWATRCFSPARPTAGTRRPTGWPP
jgi:hypothetical protein